VGSSPTKPSCRTARCERRTTCSHELTCLEAAILILSLAADCHAAANPLGYCRSSGTRPFGAVHACPRPRLRPNAFGYFNSPACQRSAAVFIAGHADTVKAAAGIAQLLAQEGGISGAADFFVSLLPKHQQLCPMPLMLGESSESLFCPVLDVLC